MINQTRIIRKLFHLKTQQREDQKGKNKHQIKRNKMCPNLFEFNYL